jgi:Protein of unknown function (DUF3108)
MKRVLVVATLVSSTVFAAGVPTDAECLALGSPEKPFAFPVGEYLEYDLDALGAEAGKLTLRVQPRRDGAIPVEVTAHTNTFFSKVRKVKATATSYLHPQTLRPKRYVEDALENDIRRYSDVHFSRSPRKVKLEYKNGNRGGNWIFDYAREALDPAGAIFLLRQLALKEGMPVCFDAYGIRRMWRVHGKVVGKERVSLKLGEFEAWHLQGEAVRIDRPGQKREIHLWVSADDRRIPLAAVGVIDLGAVRATLTAYSRPGEGGTRAQGKESLKW